jgi:hypothetical protein
MKGGDSLFARAPSNASLVHQAGSLSSPPVPCTETALVSGGSFL